MDIQFIGIQYPYTFDKIDMQTEVHNSGIQPQEDQRGRALKKKRENHVS